MKKIVCIIALTLLGMLSTESVSAAKKERVDSIPLVGVVYDRLTSRHLLGTTVDVLRPDSSVLSSVKGGNKWYRYDNKSGTIRQDSTSEYKVKVPREVGTYLLRITKEGYEPYYLSYRIGEIKKRDVEKEVPKIYMGRQKVTTLEDFTVKTSKIMFYHKGDTLVYNADAFALPEGSMLDALVAQLPGVEMKDNKIYVNGRFVESLLLNGKDFFKDNQNVMLENIGAYAVKDVAVYEKKDEMEAVLGNREDVDKEYVMDVRLKKDYMTGHMINAEVGGGTDSRYIGRLFAMRYTNNSRLALYGNANNINKSNRLNENDWEIYERQTPGIRKIANGGIDYRADNPTHTWEVEGNADASYSDSKNTVITDAVNFIQTADTYEHSWQKSRNKNFGVSTAHTLKVKKDKWNLEIKPSFSYNKNKNNDETIAATFTEEMQELNNEIIQSIYSGDYDAARKALINRNLKASESEQHGWNGQLNANARFKIPGSSDGLALKFQTKYKRDSQNGNTLQDICYGWGPQTSLLQQRFSGVRPNYDYNIQGLARYYFNIPYVNLQASYEFAHGQKRKNSDISLLEAQAENSMATFLPDALPVPDYANSYTSKLYINEHRIKIMCYYTKEWANSKLILAFQPNFIFQNQHLYYHRGDVVADPKRSYLKFNIADCSLQYSTKDGKIRLVASYNMKRKDVNLVNLVDIRNTEDPLNIWLGNPDLKNATNHEFYVYMTLNKSKQLMQDMNLGAYWTINDFVSGYRYDTATGVRTMKTNNVQGNNNAYLSHWFNWRFGSGDKFYINNSLNLNMSNYANMIGNDAEPTRQRVRNYGVDEFLHIGIRNARKFSASLGVGGRLNNTHSEGEAFTKINNGYFGTQLHGYYNFLKNFHVNTDLNVVKRFGYLENSMNRVDCIWNAEVGYSLKKGVWRFSLKAHDILNQNKGLDYLVNATGRRQTLSTVLSRYLMLTVHYRFDFKPKRK